MADTPEAVSTDPGYAMSIANGSYAWYQTAAGRSRRMYRLSETAALIVSAAIPGGGRHNPAQRDHPSCTGRSSGNPVRAPRDLPLAGQLPAVQQGTGGG